MQICEEINTCNDLQFNKYKASLKKKKKEKYIKAFSFVNSIFYNYSVHKKYCDYDIIIYLSAHTQTHTSAHTQVHTHTRAHTH